MYGFFEGICREKQEWWDVQSFCTVRRHVNGNQLNGRFEHVYLNLKTIIPEFARRSVIYIYRYRWYIYIYTMHRSTHIHPFSPRSLPTNFVSHKPPVQKGETTSLQPNPTQPVVHRFQKRPTDVLKSPMSFNALGSEPRRVRWQRVWLTSSLERSVVGMERNRLKRENSDVR